MKPILFSGEMAKAILDGWKTQTRQVIKTMSDYEFVELEQDPITVCDKLKCGERIIKGLHAIFENRESDLFAVKAKYQKDDILWVREAFGEINGCWHETEPYMPMKYEHANYVYKADYITSGENAFIPKWKSSIHMSRKAARIFLRVTDVRVERLQEINESDLLAEGVEDIRVEGSTNYRTYEQYEMACIAATLDERFIPLWDNLYAKKGYGWSANPWVWVYTFERIEKSEVKNV